MIILGIESSCDETGAAVVQNNKKILSSIIASQIKSHSKYGGVVPELASRMHTQAIDIVVDKAIQKAGIKIKDINAVAATRGPGLIGALLVGFSFAKAFAWAKKIPFAGVNHLEAHIYSLFFDSKSIEFPFIALVVSGGHTNIYYVSSFNNFELMGQTRDDAAGEAFDKVAKILELGYPGGPIIEKIAKTKNPDSINFPRAMLEKDKFDFSFSGLKSSVARYVHENKVSAFDEKAQVAASFQEAVFDVLCKKTINAALFKKCNMIGISGGVAANQYFASKLIKLSSKNKIQIFIPPIELCTDNAVMIAARGYTMIKNNDLCGIDQDIFSTSRFL